jgi:hypothetical protein
MAWQDIVAGIAGVINPSLGNVIYQNKSQTGEYLPGVDVGAAGEQLTGQGDRDIISGYSVAGGDRSPAVGQVFGQTVYPTTQSSTSTIPTGDVTQEQINQYYQEQLAAQQQAAAEKAAQDARDKQYALDYYSGQKSELERLLGRTNMTEQQGLDKILQDYNRANELYGQDRTKQLSEYSDQETQQGLNKVSSFNKLNEGANRAYRSLAQIIGRGAGTGSSAFRELLPNAIGTQVSSGREGVLQDYGQNLQKIGKAKNEYETDFANILEELKNQRANSESKFKTGIGEQRTGLNNQLMDIQSKIGLINNPDADYATIRASLTPYEERNRAIEAEMDSYYDKYKPTYTSRPAVAAKPELSQFTVDRANVNAQNQGVVGDPYANLLRKRLQEQG